MIKKEKLGEGTFGIVYQGEFKGDRQEYAVKRNLTEEETSFVGALREIDILTKLRPHTHIVKLELISFGEPFVNECFSPLIDNSKRKNQKDDKIHFIFKKASYDLRTFIYKVPHSLEVTKKFMVQILLGLEYIHQHKIIHRDIKPNNILVYEKEKDLLGDENIVKICDFGLSKPFTYQGLQTPDVVTSWYRAPEVALGYPHYDYKIDVWSVGCVFYEMVVKKPFITTSRDSDEEILVMILKNLSKEPPLELYKRIVRDNPWKKVFVRFPKVRNRKTFEERIALLEQRFSKEELVLFCDLLENMLCFDWNNRYTITQCLDHKFFDSYRNLIQETRVRFSIYLPVEKPIRIITCFERFWVANIIKEIFNNRKSYSWYNHRILFQTVSLFNRYLTIMYSDKHSLNILHSKQEAEIRFMVCLYICIKYFSILERVLPYEKIVSDKYTTEENKFFAENFELALLELFKYEIYEPTIYEAADNFGDKLGEEDIKDLIVLFSMNDYISGKKPSEVYIYYKNKLKNSPDDTLLDPLKI